MISIKKNYRVKITNEYLGNTEDDEVFIITDCINSFLNSLVSHGKASSTIEAYKNDINQFLYFLNSRKKYINEIETNDINKFKDKLFKAGCSYNTVKRKIDAVSSLFTFCNGRGWIKYNPCNNSRLEKSSDLKVKYLEKEQVELLINAFKEGTSSNWFRNKAILYILAMTGGRRTDVLELKWSDIKLAEEIIVLKNKKNAVCIDIPIKMELLEILKEMHSKEMPNPNDFVFKGKDGGRLSDTAFNEVFKKACKLSGVMVNFKLTPHCLRHSMAIYLLNSGVDIVRVSKILGHRDISTTTRYYCRIGKLTDKYHREIFDNLCK